MNTIINPNVSVDCVVFAYSNKQLKVLLIKEKAFTNTCPQQLALPGDLVSEDESLDDTAKKILFDLTKINSIYIKQFHTFGNANRVRFLKDKESKRAFRKKPETRLITVAYFALVKSEDYQPLPSSFAGETQWIPIDEIPILAFDHNEILNKAHNYLKDELIDKQMGFELLPEKFTLTELQTLYETILNIKYDKRNFRKNIKGKAYLKELKEKVKGLAHRPANLYIHVNNK
ncbi:MAG: NUDIX hydrolase [Chitinophagales bacterium]